MNHPMIIKTDEATNSIKLTDSRMQKLIDNPRPILWNRAGMYRWVPIEKIRNIIRHYNDMLKIMYPKPNEFIITLGDTVPIPKEAGDVLIAYNGHED